MKKMLAMILAAVMILTAAVCGAMAEGEWEESFCEEEQFRTKVPAAATARYEKENGGLVIYTEHDGYIPYVIVNRRPMNMKFSNPENYLNNVYREHMEDKYEDQYLGMIGIARAREIGGKQLLTAEYRFKVGEYTVVQLQLIDVRNAGDVEYTVKFIEGQDEATMAALNEAVRNYQETDTEAPAPAQAEKGILTHVDMSNTLVDNQNGTYWARITDTDRIMSGGYFTAELYVQDLYAADQVWALQEGDRVEVNGTVYTVKSLQPEQDGRRELYVQEEFDGYIAFEKTSKTACVALVNDWVPCTKVGTEKIMMPLANKFTYAWLDQDGEIGGTLDADGFVSMVTNTDSAPALNQYNTMVQFENSLLMMIGHQDYPYGPDETE